MANIVFKLREIPHAADEMPRGYFPEIANASQMSVAQLCRAIENRCTASRADIMAVMSALADIIGDQLAKGGSIDVPELGTFSPSVACDYSITSLTDKQVARHLRLKGIKFRAKKALKEKLSDVSFQRSTETHIATEVSEEEAMKEVETLFHASPNAILDRAMFQRLTHTKRMQALRMLKSLVTKGLLIKKGRDNAPYFILPQTPDETPNNDTTKQGGENA